MGGNQLTFISEAELAQLRRKAAMADKYYKMIMEAAKFFYPKREFWEGGTNFEASLAAFDQIKRDLRGCGFRNDGIRRRGLF